MKGKNPNDKKAEKVEVKENKEPVQLKIRRMSIDQLKPLIPLHSFGRFMQLKEEVRREIIETPEGQFAFIKAAHLQEDRKERAAALYAIGQVSHPLGWVVRWSNEIKGFLLVRTADWVKVKKGKKS